ncbi:MAG: M42 family metallopeptidase [Hominilimicola sp.]
MAELLKILSETNGVSGNENAVRDIIIGKIKDNADEIHVDSMGNVIAVKKGADDSKTLAVTANIDEPGFIVSSITDKGYLKFKAVGMVDARKLVSKKVVIGDDKVKGVIGMKAIHLQTRSERENVVTVSKLFIDIGAKNKSEAEKCVKLGDYVTFDTEFKVLGDNIKGKALDRSGACFALIKAFEQEYKYNVCACFLVQHEVGARGAKIVTHRINPDAVLTVSAADTEDMYGCTDINGGCELGKGVVINYSDNTGIADKTLTDKMLKAVKKAKIKIQPKVMKPHRSDAGAMQTGADGTICLNAVIPCRYSHSPVSLMSLSDIHDTADYISLFLNEIGELI